MNTNGLNVEYVKGYADATRQMNEMINKAIRENHNKLLPTINEIIIAMYKQKEELDYMVNIVEEQVEQEELPVFTINDMLDTIHDGMLNGNVTIIIGDKTQGGM